MAAMSLVTAEERRWGDELPVPLHEHEGDHGLQQHHRDDDDQKPSARKDPSAAAPQQRPRASSRRQRVSFLRVKPSKLAMALDPALVSAHRQSTLSR